MSLTRRKPAPMPPRRDRSEEFASFVLKPVTHARPVTASDLAVMAPTRSLVKPKAEKRKQQSIRDSARDEECSVRIVGVCNGRTDTTVWSHFPGIDGDRGMGMKALDLCGAYACAACHDVVDGRASVPQGATRQSVMLDWHMGHMRSLVRLHQKGLT